MALIPHRGLVQVNHIDLSQTTSRERARHLAYLPQRQQFAFPIQVEEIVLMGFNPLMGLFSSYSKQQRAKARAVLQRLGLAGFAAADYTHLSEASASAFFWLAAWSSRRMSCFSMSRTRHWIFVSASKRCGPFAPFAGGPTQWPSDPA